MKAIFSILGLLIVVAITGILVKKQFSSVSETTAKPANSTASQTVSGGRYAAWLALFLVTNSPHSQIP